MLIDSRNMPNQIEVLGFEQLDQSVHVMRWLGRGDDFRRFIIHDLEGELYSQDQGAQLLSVNVLSQPEFETKVRKESAGMQAIVTQLSLVIPVSLRVKASNGVIWILDVSHGYQAENIDLAERFRLRLSFSVVGARVDA